VSERVLAAVMIAPRQPIEVREFPRPDLPPGGALLRTARSEVCGTDVHLWHGRLSGVPYPIIPGHVSAGTNRLALAREMGADVTLDLQATSPPQRFAAVQDATDHEGADIVIEAAGAAAAIPEGLDLLRVGGRYVIAGHYTDGWGSEPRHFLRALSILERHPRIPFRQIGPRTYGLGELNEALRDAEAMRIPKALVDPWK